MTSTLVVLARSPQAGVGKTRLRRLLPAPAVDALAEAMLADTLAWSVAAGFERLVVALRGPAAPWLLEAAPGAVWLEQSEGSLGDRIEAALATVLASAGSIAVQIGTDSPTLPAELLLRARAELSSAPAALIPAEDGGWVALASTRPLGGALAEVAWSRPDTARRTVQALAAVGMPPVILPSHYDIDEPADLLRLAADPLATTRAPRTLAAVAPLLPLLHRLQSIPGGEARGSR